MSLTYLLSVKFSRRQRFQKSTGTRDPRRHVSVLLLLRPRGSCRPAVLIPQNEGREESGRNQKKTSLNKRR